MKWLPRVLFAVTLLFVGCNSPKTIPHQVPTAVTIEQKASHMVTYFDGKRAKGVCTATAIGPHALMTASHCNKDDQLTDFELDYAKRTFHIQKTLTDGADHDIYLVDGEPFHDTLDYKVRKSKPFEHVHLYGDGGGEYPPRRLDGVQVYWLDPSEVDQHDGIVKFSMPVIPGDSGSAVVADDGSIVAITTYMYKDDDTKEHTTIDVQTMFTEDQITQAVTFAPDPDWHPVYHAPAPRPQPLNPFVLFGFGD